MTDFLAVILTSGAISVLGALLAKSLIENGVKRLLEGDLERLKAELRIKEQETQAALKARDDHISSIREAAMARLSGKTAALDQRRVEAADRLWAAATNLMPFRILAKMTESLNMDELMKVAEGGGSDAKNTQTFVDGLWKVAGMDKVVPTTAEKERPFVTSTAWALFSAYRSMLSYPALQLMTAKIGAPSKVIKPADETLAMVKKALPQYVKFIDEHGTSALPLLVVDMEEALVKEIVRSAEGVEEDKAHMERATELLKAVNRVDSAIKQATAGLDPA